MSVNCPQCGTYDVQKVSVAYRANIATSNTNEQVRTPLAAVLAPPTTFGDWIGRGMGFFMGGIFAMMMHPLLIVISLIGIGIWVYSPFLIPRCRRNWAEWERKWYCHRCGAQFIPEFLDHRRAA